MPDARIVAYAAASAPSGWYACEGQSLLRSAEPDLFDAIGTNYGAADGTHFNVPDFRDRFALGKAASGTGSALGQSGGALGHQHSLSHQHTLTQPNDHASHIVTQPSAHTSLTHAGFDVDDHSSAANLSHGGMTVDNHSVTKSSAHGSHTAAGSHDHDTHSTISTKPGSGSTSVLTMSGKHSAGGSHDHDAHSAHTETVNAHSISSQGADHSTQVHSITAQPSAHSLSAHAFTVTAHGSHIGITAAAAVVTMGAADPPYLALIFIIAPSLTPIPAGAVIEYGATTMPDDYLACDGSAVSRATYGDLFAVTGEDFGPGNGTTTFNLPDLRGRHILGAGATSFAASAGSANHTHAGASHGHAVTAQAGAHADHGVTQPSHTALSHSGATVAAHSMSHSGFSVADHNVTQSGGHGTHSSDGSHAHDGHTDAASRPSGSDLYSSPTGTHSSDGSHAHDSHSAHSGADLSPHVETQATTHSATHSVTQASDHSAQTHAGAALSPHSAHSNAAINDATSSDSAASDAPYLSLSYAIRVTLGNLPIGALYKVGQASAPGGALLAQGQAISRTTYADLFAVIGTDHGAGDGSTTFNLPDVRGRIPRGANGDLGASGGALDHTHAVSSTHGHTVVQPDTHGAHTPTQPNDHGSLTHAGMAITTHSLSHAGADINNHSADQANSHSAHSSSSNHNHNNHGLGVGITDLGALTTVMTGPTAHNNEGGHTHTGAHSHSSFGVNGHSVGQADNHSLSHTVDQPNAHTVSAHAGFAVDAHGAHSGFAAIAAGTGTTDAGNPPYLVVNYCVQTEVDGFALSATVSFAIGTPELHVTDYEQTLNEIPTTPPSSPTIFILSPPE